MARFFILFLLIAAALPCAGAPAKHVVLISIDGFSAYQLYDDRLELPNIRALIDKGVWASSSETVFPSVTHPAHTSILTGVKARTHGVLSNWLINRQTGESFHPTNKKRTEIVKVETLFDAAKRAGLKTSSFFWPETKDDPSVDYNLPEVFNARKKADIHEVAPEFLDDIRSGGVAIDYFFHWYGSERNTAGDVILAEAAAHVIKKHKPGLLAIHIVSTDAIQHDNGPNHYLSKAAFTNADHCVGLMMQAAEEAGIDDKTVFVITADHGFHSVFVEANVHPAFRRAGLQKKVNLNGGGWTMAVELTDRFDRATDMQELEAAFRELRQAGIVRRVITPGELHEAGMPKYEESVYMRGHYLLIPDIDTYLTVDPESDSMARRPKAKPSHSHGYPPEHPRMHTSLVMGGAGMKSGVTIGHVRNIDLAPTIAQLLGLELKNVEGRVLEEALE